jgi:quinoprotein glucose dehydrogenase
MAEGISEAGDARPGAWIWVSAIIILVIGAALAVGGIWLILLSGSWYYVAAAVGFIATGVLLVMRRPLALWI